MAAKEADPTGAKKEKGAQKKKSWWAAIPYWAWILVAGGALGIFLLWRKMSGGSSAPSSAAQSTAPQVLAFQSAGNGSASNLATLENNVLTDLANRPRRKATSPPKITINVTEAGPVAAKTAAVTPGATTSATTTTAPAYTPPSYTPTYTAPTYTPSADPWTKHAYAPPGTYSGYTRTNVPILSTENQNSITDANKFTALQHANTTGNASISNPAVSIPRLSSRLVAFDVQQAKQGGLSGITNTNVLKLSNTASIDQARRILDSHQGVSIPGVSSAGVAYLQQQARLGHLTQAMLSHAQES